MLIHHRHTQGFYPWVVDYRKINGARSYQKEVFFGGEDGLYWPTWSYKLGDWQDVETNTKNFIAL
jgi:hypothetical protein